MWRFKPFMPKEQAGLEGRTVDIGNLKVHVRNVIAEGGFSCVYLARDAINASKQYALKHIVCSDEESLDLTMKEISVMKKLTGHPNIVALLAHTILDMGRTKEALLVMEFCEKSLVNVLEIRGSGYFEEKQILLIFRDVCNAVFAMHCLSPPIAHRDLKAENLLLGPDGVWKLCDFGSTSTNHRVFERPEEMGIEEDNIRKHTTPAYRAPEMWDLYRKEVINEKVDIWALGCLLYRICYFKSAFDGESKLQILNGNYRIPDLPKYNSSITELIRDMLEASPNARPDITQVWFRVNDQLPVDLQKSLPDSPAVDIPDGGGIHHPAKKSSPMPRRSPPPPPSSKEPAQSSTTSKPSGGPIGAFWSTQHATGPQLTPEKPSPIYDDTSSRDFELKLTPEDMNPKSSFQNEAFNSFVADFDTTKLGTSGSKKSGKEEALEVEVTQLKEELRKTKLDKDEISGKYEKLSAICRSQRQEIQELKQSLARTPSPNKDVSKVQNTSNTPQPREKIEGTVLELEQGMFTKTTPSPDSKQWQPFPDTSKTPSKSVRSTNGRQHKSTGAVSTGADNWGFETENFTAVPGSSNLGRTHGQGSSFRSTSDKKTAENKRAPQPAGWAGF